MMARVAILLLTCSAVASLRVTAASLSRRQLAARAIGMAPVLAASHAAFSTEASDDEDKAAAFIDCKREDKECIARRRAKGAKLVDFSNVELPSQEARRAAIQKQAGACRSFCGREDLRMACKRDDDECLAKRKALQEESGVAGGADVAPYALGAVAVVGAAIATAPEKTAGTPYGMLKRQQFYDKRKADTLERERAQAADANVVASSQVVPTSAAVQEATTADAPVEVTTSEEANTTTAAGIADQDGAGVPPAVVLFGAAILFLPTRTITDA